MHLQYTENCRSKFCPKTPQARREARRESSPFPLNLPARNQVPGDQFMLTNVYSFDDHCSQDGMDRNAPNLNPRYNSTEISRIGGQTSGPPSKPPWRDGCIESRHSPKGATAQKLRTICPLLPVTTGKLMCAA